jgi:ligand-binding SRPBCC domain-containing protein
VTGAIHHRDLGGGLWELETSTLLPQPPDEVFLFFSAAENLEAVTPPELRFRVLTPTPIEIGVGTLIDYRLSLFRIPFRWQTVIPVWEPGRRFVDEQRRGPYRYWHHEHRFEPEASGTRMTDRVRYRLPLHPLSLLVRPLIRRQLERIFSYRAQVIRASFAAPGPASARAGSAASRDAVSA